MPGSAVAAAPLSIFGIRHHGPGSARSLLRALADLAPDCLLIEGPPDAEAMLALARRDGMKPPVALLVYGVEDPRRASFCPYAEFSPEWQAIRYGLGKEIPVRFMDLPIANRLALDRQREEARAADSAPPPSPDPKERTAEAAPEDAHGATERPPHPRRDPLRWLAEAAGYSDSERWWEHMVEERQDGRDLFAAVLEAMTALRRELPPLDDDAELEEEALREAHMRSAIRAARKDGYERIAVVCGAWHAPALAGTLAAAAGKKSAAQERAQLACPTAKDDAALLKGLPRLKVAATWIPWTHGRLAQESGYGAGVESPGWYQHLWRHPRHIAEHWLTRVAALLREADLDASPAQTIEAVRLAETLAALRGRPLPGLAELTEAVQATFCFGSAMPLRVIREKLIVGETLGAVPEDTPFVPLQEDLVREQKRLRLPPKASVEQLELDLRKETDLDRSRLLHRLALLDVTWGRSARVGGKGTFREAWTLQWKPEFAVRVIEAGRWGNGVAAAAAARARSLADQAAALPELTELIDRVLLADLAEAAAHIMHCIRDQAAITSDVGRLMEALPPLAGVLRYGNVRQTDASMVGEIVHGLVARVCVGLPPACGCLNDDAAREMYERVGKFERAVSLLQDEELRAAWRTTLQRLGDQPQLHGLLAGRAVRLLLDAGVFAPDVAARRLCFALSLGNDPVQVAAWIEGFLAGSGAVLVYDERLWGLLDAWVTELKPDVFTQVLPLLRRTFAEFPAPERRLMGERVKRGAAVAAPAAAAADFDVARAEKALPLLRLILGPLPKGTA